MAIFMGPYKYVGKDKEPILCHGCYQPIKNGSMYIWYGVFHKRCLDRHDAGYGLRERSKKWQKH
jgi:hypothetical protein